MRGPTGPVLCAFRPGGGLLAQSVRDFDHAIDTYRSMTGLFSPGLLAEVVWWVAPDTHAVFAGSEMMADG